MFVLLFMIILIVAAFITIINNYFSSRVELYATQKALSSASDTISNVITTKVLSNLDLTTEDNLIIESDGDITINTIKINNVLKEVNNILSNDLEEMAFESITIPYAIIISELLFSKTEAGLSVLIRPVGAYTTDIITKVEEYGINNTLFKIELLVKVNIEVLIPYNLQAIEVETSLPLVIRIVQGEVPPGIWYGGGIIE